MKAPSYSAKLLLFGEYTIIKGGPALAVPLPAYAGKWAWAKEDQAIKLQQNLSEFAAYLLALQSNGDLLADLNISNLTEDLRAGLYFQSNIPGGYGAGSSGALCAGIYDRYNINPKKRNTEVQLPGLKKELAQLESFFHGSSSGIDPLICYINGALLFQSKETIEFFSLPDLQKSSSSFFLIDTGLPRKTAPLVNQFLEMCKEDYYLAHLFSELIPYTENAIHHLEANNAEGLFESMHQISYYQYKYFLPMIPEPFRNIWLNGLENDIFKLKICGAGGGGFILGITKNFDSFKENFDSDFSLIPLSL